MMAVSYKVNGLFSSGDDFEDEDFLETDWDAASESRPADAAAAVPSCALRASSAAHAEREERSNLKQTVQRSSGPCQTLPTRLSAQTLAGKSDPFCSKSLPTAASSPTPMMSPKDFAENKSKQDSATRTESVQQNPCLEQDDFDDWDIDLADLDECEEKIGESLLPRAPPPAVTTFQPVSLAKSLQSASCRAALEPARRSQRQPGAICQLLDSSPHYPPHQAPSTVPLRSPNSCHALPSAPPQSPSVFPGFTVSSPIPSSISKRVQEPQQPHKPQSSPGPSPRGPSDSVCQSPSSVSTSSPNAHLLHRPVLTNHLVQLVSASNKLPRKRPHSVTPRSKTRRFPGPAGLLPQQPQGQSLDDIVVSVPQTPAHGAVARSPSQVGSSQSEDDEFHTGPWATMKAEMGLDERQPSCFLHSYSVVMVLRKAALKQLARNKVPNMAVQLKSIINTHADAKVVFRDPTGEIQGTVHRRLLEDRQGELRVGAVLLLKQVGVFSPSHRNHYLNVTSNNLLRIYSPDGDGLTAPPLAPFVPPVLLSPVRAPTTAGEPVSWMRLMFDEEEDGGAREEGNPIKSRARDDASGEAPESARNLAPVHCSWEADDNLDELLSDLPEDADL